MQRCSTEGSADPSPWQGEGTSAHSAAVSWWRAARAAYRGPQALCWRSRESAFPAEGRAPALSKASAHRLGPHWSAISSGVRPRASATRAACGRAASIKRSAALRPSATAECVGATPSLSSRGAGTSGQQGGCTPAVGDSSCKVHGSEAARSTGTGVRPSIQQSLNAGGAASDCREV